MARVVLFRLFPRVDSTRRVSCVSSFVTFSFLCVFRAFASSRRFTLLCALSRMRIGAAFPLSAQIVYSS